MEVYAITENTEIKAEKTLRPIFNYHLTDQDDMRNRENRNYGF